MEGEDRAEQERRSIPSLAYALEEARLRAARLQQMAGERYEAAPRPLEQEAERETTPATVPHGSLLDLAAPSDGSKPDRIELARMAMEAIAARRALSGAGSRRGDELQHSLEEVRSAVDECLLTVRECRDLMRSLATKRDRNYF